MINSASKGQARMGLALIIAFLLASLAAAAGGLPLPYVVGVMALVSIPVGLSFRQARPIAWEAVLMSAVLGWIGLTFLWSPYESPDHLITILILLPILAAFVFAAGRLTHPWKARAEAACLLTAFTMALFFFLEFVTGGSATLSFKLAIEGAIAGAQQTQIEVDRSLGHGVLVIVLLAGPAAALAWREGGPLIGLLLLAIVGVCSLGFETQVNTLAFLIASIASAITYYFPRATISALFGTIAGAFIVVPLTLPSVAASLPDNWVSAIPHSFEIRLEIWKYAGERLAQKPLLGWGFDSSRMASDLMEIRGVTTPLLPLHPHNGPLHLWLETGAIGAVLMALTLVLIGGRIASAKRLSRLQATAITWVVSSYFIFVFFGYGLWQEWHLAALAMALAGCRFLAARLSSA